MAKRKNSEEDEDMMGIPSLDIASFSPTMKEAVFQRVAPLTQWNLYKSSKEMKEVMREPLLKNLRLKYDIVATFQKREFAVIRPQISGFYDRNLFKMKETLAKLKEECFKSFFGMTPDMADNVLRMFDQKSKEL